MRVYATRFALRSGLLVVLVVTMTTGGHAGKSSLEETLGERCLAAIGEQVPEGWDSLEEMVDWQAGAVCVNPRETL